MIKYLIAERLLEHLQTNLNTGISELSPYYVREIESFRYLSNPAVDGTRIIIFADNPDEIDYKDSRIDVSQPQQSDLSYHVPVGEIGGGHLWWRRGTVKIEYYGIGKFAQEDRYEAAEVAYKILGRVHYYLDFVRISDLKDTYNEQGVYFHIINSAFKESGGNKVNIWRGTIYWQALTQREV